MVASIDQIISEQLTETVHREFKGSQLLNSGRRDEICKSVCALANADGGTIYFGVSENKASNNVSLDGGVGNAPRMIEWLDNVISDHVSPKITNLIITSELKNSAGYIIVEVPKSTSAPHQSSDYRFYKRSNNRSVPMEAYEIEDVRHRRLAEPSPLVLGIELSNSGGFWLSIRNRSHHLCFDLDLKIRSNFNLAAFSKAREGDVRLSRIGVGQFTEYFLGTTHHALSECEDASLELSGSYRSEASNAPIQISDRMNIGELKGSTLPRNDTEKQLKEIVQGLKELKSELNAIRQVTSGIADTFGGSGIRLSPLSLAQLKQPSEAGEFSSFRYDPGSLTLTGMAELLETTQELVREFYFGFQVFGGRNDIAERLKKASS